MKTEKTVIEVEDYYHYYMANITNADHLHHYFEKPAETPIDVFDPERGF